MSAKVIPIHSNLPRVVQDNERSCANCRHCQRWHVSPKDMLFWECERTARYCKIELGDPRGTCGPALKCWALAPAPEPIKTVAPWWRRFFGR